MRFDTRDGLRLLGEASSLPLSIRSPGGRSPLALICSVSATSVLEPVTGYDFPSRLCFEMSDDIHHCPRLCGVGTRQKRLVGVKQLHVYALGLYVSEDYVPEDARMWDDELVGRSDVDKIISIVISSGFVSRKKFVNALDDALLPAVKATCSEATLNRFRDLFDNVAFKKGLHIDFYLRDGKLTTKVDGRALGTLSDPYFTSAFAGVYLGADPVSPKAKEAFRKGILDDVERQKRGPEN